MSKTKTYFMILAVAAIVVAVGYIMNIAAIKSFSTMCFNYAGDNWVSVTAAVCAFVFLGNKNYWLILLACAVVAALITQLVIIGQGIGIMTLAARCVAFLSIAFLMNFVKLLINK